VLSTGALAVGTAQADDNASQFCKGVDLMGISHGACVSLVHGNPTAFISDLCKVPGAPEAIGTTNHGQCVKELRATVAGL
jgi:hypothetical protein